MKWKLQTLDWYLIKKFLGTFFFTLAIFLAIAVVFDYSEKVDDFIAKKHPFQRLSYCITSTLFPIMQEC